MIMLLLVKYSLVCYEKHSYHTYLFLVFFLLSLIPMSTDRVTSSDKREIWTCMQSSYGPEPNLSMYAAYTLSHDPVDV